MIFFSERPNMITLFLPVFLVDLVTISDTVNNSESQLDDSLFQVVYMLGYLNRGGLMCVYCV